jgi:hypothetical protein
MESAKRHPVGLAIEHALQSAAHLVGGLVGEGDGQNMPGLDPEVLDKISDAVGKHACLAAPRACQDQVRSQWRGYCLKLLRVKLLEHSGDIGQCLTLETEPALPTGSGLIKVSPVGHPGNPDWSRMWALPANEDSATIAWFLAPIV